MTDKKEPHMGRFAEAQENVEIGEKRKEAGEIIPPLSKKEHHVGDLSTLEGVREEMAKVYRLARSGKLEIGQVTKMIYVLDKISVNIRNQAELAAMHQAYNDAWTGLNIIPPSKPVESD